MSSSAPLSAGAGVLVPLTTGERRVGMGRFLAAVLVLALVLVLVSLGTGGVSSREMLRSYRLCGWRDICLPERIPWPRHMLSRSDRLSAYRLIDEKIDCSAAIEPLCRPARLMNWSSWGDGDVSSWQSVWAEHLAIRGLPLGRNRRDRRWSLRGLFLHSFLVDAANRYCEFRARRISAANQGGREI